MDSRYAWISSTWTNIQTKTSSALSTLSSACTNLTGAFADKWDTWCGFSHPYHIHVVPKIFSSSPLKKALWIGVAPNLFYGANIFAYEWIINPFLKRYLLANGDFVSTSAYWLIDSFINESVLKYQKYVLMEHNFISVLNVAKAASMEYPQNNPFSPSSDGLGAKMAGAISSFRTYMLMTSMLKVAPAVAPYVLEESRIPYFNYIHRGLSAVVFGRMLVEFEQDAAALTIQERYETMPFLFSTALGASYELLCYLENAYLFRAYGTKPHIDTLFANLLYYYFVTAVHVNKMPFTPGRKNWDIFKPIRALANGIWNIAYGPVVAAWNSTEETYISKLSQQVVSSRPALLMRKYLFRGMLLSVQQFVKQPHVSLFLDLQEPFVRDYLTWIGGIRMLPYVEKGPTFAEYVGKISASPSIADYKWFLELILKRETQETLAVIREFLLHFRLNNQMGKPARKILTELEKQNLSIGIDREVARLREEIKPLDKKAIQACIDKMFILEELVRYVGEATSWEELERNLERWKRDYALAINTHRQQLMILFKKTATAQFIEDILKSTRKGAPDEFISKLKKITKRANQKIGLLHKELLDLSSDNFVLTEKIHALLKLDALINQEEYAAIEFNTILSIWKEYYWYVITAHRSLMTIVSNKIVGYVGFDDKAPLTVKFLEEVTEVYSAKPVPKMPDKAVVPRLAPTLFNPPESRALPPSDNQIVSTIIKEIEAEIKRLQKKREESVPERIRALSILKNELIGVDVADARAIVAESKRRNWQILNAPRKLGSRMLHFLAENINGENTQAKTDTAEFYEKIELRLQQAEQSISPPPSRAMVRVGGH